MRSHLGHSLCILFGIVWHRIVAIENITSLLPVSTSAPPTKLHSRITVSEEKSSTVDILANSNARREGDRSVDHIWRWDHWCKQQPKRGACRQNNVTMYYYLARLDQCTTFKYSGCNGNENLFNTQKECERYCLGSGLMYQEKIDQTLSCELQPSGGVCLGYMTKMYYDINEASCKSFLYSGCGGNGNNFDTDEECMKVCGEHMERKGREDELRAQKGSSSSEERNWK